VITIKIHLWLFYAVQSDFTALHERRLLFTLAKKEKQRSITGNNSSQLDNNESCEHCVDLGFGLDRRAKEPSKLHCSHTNIPRHLMFKHDYTYKYNQHRRKEIVRRFSSSVISTIVFLGIFYNIWNNQLPIINAPLLRKEHDGLLSIWPSLLGLFGFMVFICAVAVMILVGAPFTGMQKAMLIFWAILMHLQSANSIIEVLVTLVGGLFMGWYAFGETK